MIKAKYSVSRSIPWILLSCTLVEFTYQVSGLLRRKLCGKSFQLTTNQSKSINETHLDTSENILISRRYSPMSDDKFRMNLDKSLDTFKKFHCIFDSSETLHLLQPLLEGSVVLSCSTFLTDKLILMSNLAISPFSIIIRPCDEVCFICKSFPLLKIIKQEFQHQFYHSPLNLASLECCNSCNGSALQWTFCNDSIVRKFRLQLKCESARVKIPFVVKLFH